MKPETRAKFMEFSVPKEGRVPWMYLDIKGLVTVGVGNLIDPIEYAVPLPFRRKSDNNHAQPDEIRAEWRRIKGRQELAQQGHRAAGRVATLYLDEPAIDALVYAKLDSNDAILKRQFPDFETWPWQAQLALHSMAWARGPNGFERGYPRFTAACRAQDWAVAAMECKIAGEASNPGLVPRNEANRRLFSQATGHASGGASDVARPAPPPTPARGSGSWLEALVALLGRIFRGKRT